MAGIRDKFYEGLDVNDPYAIMNYYFYTSIFAKVLETGVIKYYFHDKKRSYTFTSENVRDVLHERDVCIKYDGDVDLIVEDTSPNIYESMDLPPFPKNRFVDYHKSLVWVMKNIYKYQHNGRYHVKVKVNGKQYSKNFGSIKEAIKYRNQIKRTFTGD